MFLILLSLIGGLVFLTMGAEGLIRGSVALGRNARLSPLFMGLTLVAMGTSSPELLTNLQAVLSGSPGIALGNIVGSNIYNIAVILGLSAIIMGGLTLNPRTWSRDTLAMLLATTAFTLVLQFLPVISHLMGLLFLTCLTFYLMLLYRLEIKDPSRPLPDEVTTTPRLGMFFAVSLTAAGVIGLVIGANLLVNAATALAKLWGVAETVIGLTIVTFGTTLPELTTSLVAALKKQPGIAIGNILGSNIFNILGIVGFTAFMRPISIPAQLMQDGWIMLAVALAFTLFTRAGYRLSRAEGMLFLGGFAIYLWHLLS